MPKPNRKFQFSLRARVAVPGYDAIAGLVVARTQAITAENSYRVEFAHNGVTLEGLFGESGLRAANPAPVAGLTGRDLGLPASVIEFFEACVVTQQGAIIAARKLYQAYLRHAVDAAACPVTERRFAMAMQEQGIASDRTATMRRYLDIALRSKPKRKR